jgi:hypothetical protein
VYQKKLTKVMEWAGPASELPQPVQEPDYSDGLEEGMYLLVFCCQDKGME